MTPLDRITTLAAAPYSVAVRDAGPGMRVRAAGDAVDLIELDLAPGAGPTRAELEAALGPARELPRIPLTGFAVLAFPARGAIALFAHVDDAGGRASRLIARNDSS